jgi:hypothetical protein
MQIMSDFGKINTQIKTGSEPLTISGKPLRFKLLDFWRWNGSDIISNTTRGRLAEFIVATATNVDLKTPRDEWQSYDLKTPDNIKIEIKSSAYIQSWYQTKLSNISFSIRPARDWNSETGVQSDKPQRHADVYVFCLLIHCDQSSIDPLDMSQWEFYVLSIKEISDYQRSQSSITLRSLIKLTKSVDYSTLNTEIKNKNSINIPNEE